ncbi:hypothetical protein GFH30_00885 [Acinetobacter wanghuae]|uniref:Uncharacterized protein n=1 Tax=Acinetobacter wanghuae TaxID=2662362 RepID=A0A5Q0P0R4_9GAMM|nr:hypothetical protein [Acinetobacter wanghuae]MQW91942.1 hypothetical protein [Acinetobacter wanghuae]QGA10040.1 hypothetical protein GFH30_00885 [Acinetobacter wanghuae]
MNNSTTNLNQASILDNLKTEIIEDTIRNLLEENDGTFDLTTPEGIQNAVDYTVDYLMINKIKVDLKLLSTELIRHLPVSKG